MAWNYEYPYFDAGYYNIDWLLHKIKELEETVIGLETFKYIGENEILDLNQQKQNSIATFTSNFNVLNAPISNVQRVTVTYGSETAYIQQLYDLANFTVYTRNYSTASGWTAWKMTQNKPGTNLHTTPLLNSGNLNDMQSNTATIAHGNGVQNAPTHNWGFIITWNAADLDDKIQLWFDMSNSFCYIRYANPNWNPWLELNHIDLTPYLKSINVYTTGDDLNALPKNRITLALDKATNIPIRNGNFHVMSLGSSNSNDQMQIAYQRGANEIWLRTNVTGTWINLTKNRKLLHKSDVNDSNNVTSNTYYPGTVVNSPEGKATSLIGFGQSETGDCYQIGVTADSNFATRFGANGNYSQWSFYAHQSSRTVNVVGNIPYTETTLDDGTIMSMYGDNIYSEIATDVKLDYTSLPAQSLLHADEGKQSFKDAILSADLSDTDVVMTNLEMWDMDIPLETIVEEVLSLAEAITAKNPMCELTLLSIPPIDIPLWGDELLDYTMPNGSKIRQLDDRLFRLSEDNAFTYISFEYFYDAQNANLMEYLGEDFKTNKQYLRRVGSFIKNTM